MSRLHTVDSFRSGQVEIHEGVNAVSTLTENSVYQYSRVQTQRIDETLQRIDQKKEKKDAVNNKENLETTISQDLADGHTANLDASLKLLSEDNPKLFIPGDELEDDEIHIIGTTQGGTHSLQDYQMQLMLLEQQNKKRMLMARQEADHGPLFDQVAAARESRRRFERDAIKKEQIEAAGTLKPSRNRKATQIAPRMPTTGTDPGTGSAKKRQKRGHQVQTQLAKVENGDVMNGRDSKVAQAQSSEVSDHCI